MNRKATRWGAAALIVGVGMVVAFTRPEPAMTTAAGSAPVTVVNTPLPVALQGTGSITGNVNAAQSGPWSVGVTTLPAVQLAPGTTVTVNGGSVSFDDPAKQAYVVHLCASYYDDCGTIPEKATLPFGTRYVIEQVSGHCVVRNEAIDGWVLTARLNGQNNDHEFRDRLSAEDGASATGLFFEQTRIYVDGGGVDGLSVHTISGGFTASDNIEYCKITMSGHLVQMGAQFPAAP